MTESFPEYRTRLLGYLGSRDPVGVLRVTAGQLARFLTGASRTLEAAHDLNHLRQIRALIRSGS
jgi:hypothetical protein